MSEHYSGSRHLIASCALFVALLVCGALIGDSPAMNAPGVMNGFYFQKVPSSYADQERLFAAMGNTGAQTAIVELPLTGEGLPDFDKIPDIVYLVHKARL